MKIVAVTANELPVCVNAAGTVAYMSADERREASHRMCGDIHDELSALRSEAYRGLLKGALGPDGVCPVCQRKPEEVAGPTVESNRVHDGAKRPSVGGDDFTNPAIENLIGHEVEHAAGNLHFSHS